MSTSNEEGVSTPKLIGLPDGKELNPGTAFRLTGLRPAKVVVLAGAAKSGKTTLVTSLYEKFQEGPFAGFSFAGSATLPGFEERSHLGRMASEGEDADTERTKLKPEQQLLHIRTFRTSTRARQDLYFTDVSGEKYRLARDFTEECKRLLILKRADILVLLIDGGRLVDLAARQLAYADGESLLRSCIEAEMLGQNSRVDVIFSKYDLIQAGGDQTKQFIHSIQEKLKSKYSSKVGRLRFYSVAARPKNPPLTFGYGLDTVFEPWAGEELSYYPARKYVSASFPANNEFDKYLARRLQAATVLEISGK